MVPPSEGNEARREGRQGVGAPHSTDEAGEPARGTPWREGGAGSWNRWRERWPGTPSPDPISTKRLRIAELARRCTAGGRYHARAPHGHGWMHEAYRRRARTGPWAWTDRRRRTYATDLEDNLQSLLDRAKSGRTGRRPCDGCTSRRGRVGAWPIGIPTFEDKILQRAVAMVLEAVYEQDFLDCSYGFPAGPVGAPGIGRALAPVDGGGGGWVLEVDIRKFFNSADLDALLKTQGLELPTRSCRNRSRVSGVSGNRYDRLAESRRPGSCHCESDRRSSASRFLASR